MIEKLKKIHRDSEQLDFNKIWKEGTFIFDSNVLLDLYRLPESAREDLISVFENENFKSRIWIGFQVALEFLNNKYEAISDQKNKFNSVRKLLNKAENDYSNIINELTSELKKLKLKQRHSLIDPDKFITSENTSKGINFISDFISELDILEKEQSDVNDKDKIKEVVFKIFEGKIGEGFDKITLDKICEDGKSRYENKIPPGYEDHKKKGSYLFEDKEHIRKFGDLILWKEIIEKAKSENLKYVVLVTGDVKEDWWFEKRGKKLGPRRELLNEIYTEATELDCFYMYDTSNFLQYAKNELEINIQESTINETKDLIELSRTTRQKTEDGYINLSEFLVDAADKIGNLTIEMDSSVENLEPIKLNFRSFFSAIMEIYLNVLHHGDDNNLSIHANEINGFIILRFKNLAKNSLPSSFISSEKDPNRGHGMPSIINSLSNEGIAVRTIHNELNYIIELSIPKNHNSAS